MHLGGGPPADAQTKRSQTPWVKSLATRAGLREGGSLAVSRSLGWGVMRSMAWAAGHGCRGLTQSEPEPQPPAQSRSPWARSSLRSILQREERGEGPHSHPSTCRSLWDSEAHSRAPTTSTPIVRSILAMPLPLKSQKSHLRSEGQSSSWERGREPRPRPTRPRPPATDHSPHPHPHRGSFWAAHKASGDTWEWTPRLELAVTYGP